MSAGSGEEVDSALSLVADAKLPHPLAPLLQCFVLEALHPRLAARYILERCRAGEDHRNILLVIVSDWRYIVESLFDQGSLPPPPDGASQSAIERRDGGICCITGKPGQLWDPLVVIPIVKVPTRWSQNVPRIYEMLGVFFTPSYRDWWLAYARSSNMMNPLHSHWLVRKSAAHAFRQGLIRFDRLQPSMIEYKINTVVIDAIEKDTLDIKGRFPVLGDHSRSGLQKVDPRFLGTHARFSLSVRWIYLAEHFAANDKPSTHSPGFRLTDGPASVLLRPGRQRRFSLMDFLASSCIAIWRKFPRKIRIGAYKLLQLIGHRIYGTHPLDPVQRLPFGLYLKHRMDVNSFRNEFNAMKLARQYTTVPVPRPIDVVSLPKESNGYLLMSRVPGVELGDCMDMMSDRDFAELIAQMQDLISQLRAIPKTVSPEFAICNTLGEPCRDTRIEYGDPIGPFIDEAAFSQLLRNSDEPSRRGHSILFTHADLNVRNILVDRVTQSDGRKGWKVTGIVDWENSGFYPEYWEYTRSLFEGFRYSDRVRDMLHEIFKAFGDYSKEFEVEKRSWEEGDYI